MRELRNLLERALLHTPDDSQSLTAYTSGDLLRALADAPAELSSGSDAARTYFAALKLAVGQVEQAEALLDAASERRPPARPEVGNSSERAGPEAGAPRHELIAAVKFQELATLSKPATSSAWLARSYYLQSRSELPAALTAARRATELALAHAQFGDHAAARRDLQTAAALKPHRGLFRSYLGKAWSQSGQDKLAANEFGRAQKLDPADPTAWLYSALHRHQTHQINDAVRDLERSMALNDNRSVFRSRLQLDRDRATRSADLAAIYDAAGLTEVGERAASRAVQESYSDFAGHLFLAQSLQGREDPQRFARLQRKSIYRLPTSRRGSCH